MCRIMVGPNRERLRRFGNIMKRVSEANLVKRWGPDVLCRRDGKRRHSPGNYPSASSHVPCYVKALHGLDCRQ
jgi:hypothetical protein